MDVGITHLAHMSALQSVERRLQELTVQTFQVSGGRIRDRESLFSELKTLFELPEWCGPSWDALDDCFNSPDESVLIDERMAILWLDADVTARQYLKGLVESVASFSWYVNGQLLNQYVSDWKPESANPRQVEVFLFGTTEEFPRDRNVNQASCVRSSIANGHVKTWVARESNPEPTD